MQFVGKLGRLFHMWITWYKIITVKSFWMIKKLSIEIAIYSVSAINFAHLMVDEKIIIAFEILVSIKRIDIKNLQ